jgi:hypothetical protein
MGLRRRVALNEAPRLVSAKPNGFGWTLTPNTALEEGLVR